MLGDWPIVREEKEERGGEDKSGCLCFIWNCPPQATHGRPRLEAVWPVDSHTHTHIHSLTQYNPSHIRSLSSFTIDRSCVSTFAISFLVCRHLLSSRAEEGEAYSRPPLTAGPESASVFILHFITCHSFRRDRLFSHGAHSALFINTQTQEVLFIRQSDRDQLGVRSTSAQRGECVEPPRG